MIVKTFVQRSVLASMSKTKSEALARLTELTAIPQTASEDRACPVTHDVARIAEQVILLADEGALEKWNIFPDTNGAVSLELKPESGKTGNISIGVDGYSYYILDDNNFEMKDHAAINIDDIVACINQA